MLVTLYIENIAVIERAELSPAPGFNVLTGETGAGKSIILDALHAIAGGRSSRELIRTGQDRATVRALFCALSPTACRILADNGIECEDGSILLSREMHADGRNICRAGGKPCTLALLRELGGELISILGQHDGRQLLDPSEHLGFLDAYAGVEAELSDYREKYRIARAVRSRLVMAEESREARARRSELLDFQIRELTAADIRPGELSELSERKKTLDNADKIRTALSGAADCLAGDGGAGAESLLSAAGRALVGVAPLSPEAGAAADRVAELAAEAEALAKTLTEAAEALREEPGEKEAIRERMESLRRLLPKYGGDEATALEYLEKARTERETLSAAEGLDGQLAADYAEALAAAKAAAAALSARRREAARRLKAEVEAELAYLEMPGCRIFANFAENGKLSPMGADKMEFYLAPNPGEEPKPLAKIASGGEMSRIMLALRNVLRADPGRTLVFDEVDTGVSGRAAQRVGEKLYGASLGNQVLCVTHLSQIAAMGDAHFSVRKSVRDGRTVTDVLPLDEEGRAGELARITGGFRITETLIAGAKEQLRAAEEYKKPAKEGK